MEEQNIRKGILAIIYDHNGDFYFLILHRVLGWEGWEFMKGGYENGESWKDALLREVVEETGLSKFSMKKKLDEKYEFTDPEGVLHSHDVFLVETSMNIPVTIHNNEDKEHDTYLWTTFDSALEKIKWPEQKEIFKLAFEEIKNLKKD